MTKRVFGRQVRTIMVEYCEEAMYRHLRYLTTQLNGASLDENTAFGFIGKLTALQELMDTLEGEAKEEIRLVTKVDGR